MQEQEVQKEEKLSSHPWVRKISWRKEWLPTPVFLPGETHGQRSLEGCIQSTGSQRVGHDWVTNTFTFHILDKELIFKVQKKRLQLNFIRDKQSKNTLKGKIFRHFTKEEIQILREYIQKSPESLVIQQLPIRRTMKYPHTFSRKSY